MINHEPIEINANIEKNNKELIRAFNDDCLQHALCHCICHTGGVKHCVPCCYECPYCHKNVVYTGQSCK